MDRGTVWTADIDARLLSLRALGLAWGVIGHDLHMERSSVRERGRRLGAQRVPQPRMSVTAGMEERPPLPPGHPDSWGLITRGTVLEGEAYPFPVFA